VRDHDSIRSKYGITAPLNWSNSLAEQAYAYANRCTWDLIHDQNRGPVGENLALWTSGALATPYHLGWMDEEQFYTCSSKTCLSGEICGHFTQMIWQNSHTIGCGVAKCSGFYRMICRYFPAGNYINQHPLTGGASQCAQTSKCNTQCPERSCGYSCGLCTCPSGQTCVNGACAECEGTEPCCHANKTFKAAGTSCAPKDINNPCDWQDSCLGNAAYCPDWISRDKSPCPGGLCMGGQCRKFTVAALENEDSLYIHEGEFDSKDSSLGLVVGVTLGVTAIIAVLIIAIVVAWKKGWLSKTHSTISEF